MLFGENIQNYYPSGAGLPSGATAMNAFYSSGGMSAPKSSSAKTSGAPLSNMSILLWSGILLASAMILLHLGE